MPNSRTRLANWSRSECWYCNGADRSCGPLAYFRNVRSVDSGIEKCCKENGNTIYEQGPARNRVQIFVEAGLQSGFGIRSKDELFAEAMGRASKS